MTNAKTQMSNKVQNLNLKSQAPNPEQYQGTNDQLTETVERFGIQPPGLPRFARNDTILSLEGRGAR